MPAEPMIRFDSVDKVYRPGVERANLRAALPGRIGRPFRKDGFWALRGVSFEVAPSEIVGIIGPNGAGKSTTLKLVARVVAPSRGRVTTRGRIASLIELGVGFHPDLTGAENVRFSAAVLGMSKSEVKRRYDEIVDFAGISDFMGTPVKRYSSGMLARLGFAVASHLDADVILVDEVLSVGDAQFQRRGFERMRELRASGATLLLVTHNLLVVPELCQRALRLSGGQIVDEGDPRRVVDRYMASASTQPAGSREGRSGIHIQRLELSTTAIRPGGSLGLDLEVHVAEPVEDCRITVVFVTPGDLHAAGFDIAGSEQVFERAGTWRLRGEIPQLFLVPDQYRVTVTVVQQVGELPVTVDQAAAHLAVIGDGDRQYGMSYLTGDWSVGQISAP